MHRKVVIENVDPGNPNLSLDFKYSSYLGTLFISLSHSFPLCKMGIIIVHVSKTVEGIK